MRSPAKKGKSKPAKVVLGKADSAKKLPSTSTVDRWNQKKVQWLDHSMNSHRFSATVVK
ncbi:MAG: hypothetical protein CM1200mP2_43130 [Planctomycetaceae bacterium]|nr:MAG: hypothetical protein CM1200mP2_43130 [Planctomycetaceae bacterium]